MDRAVNYRERATHCRDLAHQMACPDNRAKLRRVAEQWELLAGAHEAGPPPPTSPRTAQAQDFLARAAEAESQAARGTGCFTIQLLGMAGLWRSMARKARALFELEQALTRGDLDAPVP